MHIETNSIRLRDNLRSYLDQVLASGERVLITRHGKPVAALVSPRDLEALEKAENGREALLRARQEAQMREFQALKAGLDGDR